MKKMYYYLGLLLFISCINLEAQQKKQPKLIVGIVVDQMRYDYLTKFYKDFGEGGFKKLVEEGFSANQVNYNYKPTYTGPGHASIFTGVSPAIHGIVGNNWYSREEGKVVYCASRFDANGNANIFNPSRMLSETFGDGMKQYFDFQSKSYGISLKDRGAILPAGHLADAAYWFSSKKGIWVSSEYYSNNQPQWLKTFNQQDLKEKYLKNGWSLSLAPERYKVSQPDETNYEGRYTKKVPSVFPYKLEEIYQKRGNSLFKQIPQGNQMSADLAKELIRQEKLGKGTVPDFLSLSFSATDYVGHRFGVQSMEVHDTYLKLDETLADFIQFLEAEVGKGEVLLFLTSDHGAGIPINYLKEKGLPGGLIEQDSLKKKLEKQLSKTFGKAERIEAVINFNVYFKEEVREAGDFNEILMRTKSWLLKQDGILEVLKNGDLNVSDSEIVQRAINGIMPSRSGDLIIVKQANWSDYVLTGSTHGSPYRYDTHVPALFYGTNVKQGASSVPYAVTDIISTVSMLSGIPFSNSNSTTVIKELIE